MLRPLATFAVLAVAVALPATAQAAPAKKLYVNLGDSYATGVQDRGATKQGYADQLLKPARKRGWNLKLVELRLRRGELDVDPERQGLRRPSPRRARSTAAAPRSRRPNGSCAATAATWR